MPKVIYLKKYWVIHINIPKNGIIARKLLILHLFLLKKMRGQWNDNSIDRHSYGYVEFIVDTIRYDKHYTTKLSFIDILIIDHLNIILTLISSNLIKPSNMIQALSIYTNFLFFFRNIKKKIADHWIFFFW